MKRKKFMKIWQLFYLKCKTIVIKLTLQYFKIKKNKLKLNNYYNKFSFINRKKNLIKKI